MANRKSWNNRGKRSKRAVARKKKILEERTLRIAAVNSCSASTSTDNSGANLTEAIAGCSTLNTNQWEGLFEEHSYAMPNLDNFSDHDHESIDVDCVRTAVPMEYSSDKECPSQSSSGLFDTQTSEPEIDLDNAWGTQEEYESVMNHDLCIEHVKSVSAEPVIEGNRIVDLNYVLSWSLVLQVNHSKICTCGTLYLWKEVRNGLVSLLIFKCTMCNRIIKKSTQDSRESRNLVANNNNKTTKPHHSVNIAAVWGTLSTGSSYAHLQELFSLLEIPCFQFPTFQKIETFLGDAWHDNLVEEFTAAGVEEAEIAREKDNLDSDGIPFITVYVDGGWSKRSYGHNYNALSGTAIIIGKETKKALYMGVRNKFCYVCTVAANRKVPVGVRRCFKNWEGSSSAMESSILVEGFCKSEEMHGVRYRYFIGDGDSSVFANLKTKVPYGSQIQKIACTNHILKNYTKHLYALRDEKCTGGKKYLTLSKIKEMGDLAKHQIKHNHRHGTIEELKEDLSNINNHTSGSHGKCKPYYCSNGGDGMKKDFSLELKASGLFQKLEVPSDSLVAKAHQLFHDETNNTAEQFMSLVAKYNQGKRLNLVMKGSFGNRCTLATLQYNQGPDWQLNSWRKVTRRTPRKNLKKLVHEKTRRIIYKRNNPPRRVRLFKKPSKNKHDNDYGIHALEPQMDDDEMKKESSRILAKMQVTPEERDSIQKNTVGQFGNAAYEEERKNRLTASMFGKIIRRRPKTHCHNDVKSILYSSNFYSEATEYGKINEKHALEKFSIASGLQIESSGLFVDLEYGFLGASPDGLVIGENALVEVKCLYSVAKAGLSLQEAVSAKKTCLQLEGNGYKLKRNHQYYYQIQGQLNVSGRDVCYFVIFVNQETDIFVEKIERDADMWRNEMLPKLVLFYEKYVVPEVIMRRVPKGLKCWNPV